MNRMSLKSFPGVIALVFLAAGAAPAAQQKPEPPPAPSPIGKWSLTAEVPNNTMTSTLDLKADPKDAKKLAGTLAGQTGEVPVQGEFAAGKLFFSVTFTTGSGQNIDVTFTGAFRDDGSLAGTLDYGQGPVNWTATRVKEK